MITWKGKLTSSNLDTVWMPYFWDLKNLLMWFSFVQSAANYNIQLLNFEAKIRSRKSCDLSTILCKWPIRLLCACSSLMNVTLLNVAQHFADKLVLLFNIMIEITQNMRHDQSINQQTISSVSKAQKKVLSYNSAGIIFQIPCGSLSELLSGVPMQQGNESFRRNTRYLGV